MTGVPPAPAPTMATVLLDLLARARAAKTREALGFVMLNETRRLLRYRQAVLWDGVGRPAALSGIVRPERDAPFAQWLRELYRALAGRPAGPVAAASLVSAVAARWAEWLPAHAVWLPVESQESGGNEGGAMLFARESPWSEEETRLLVGLVDAYRDTGRRYDRRRGRKHPPCRVRRRLFWAATAVVVIVAGFVPVPLTVLAPAEIVAVNPEVIRAPMDGVVARLHARPNQEIAAGQPLVDLDDTALRSRLTVAETSLAARRLEYDQAAQQGMSDPEARGRLVTLAGQIAEHAAEAAYLGDLLGRLRVTATRAGTAVLSDAGDWTGRPVRTGERILAVAGEHEIEIEAWLAVGDAVELPPGAQVSVFLNARPLAPVHGALLYVAYRAETLPDGMLAYRLRATIDGISGAARPRLGLKGTARITAGEVKLAYWLLRRPHATLRQTLGL